MTETKRLGQAAIFALVLMLLGLFIGSGWAGQACAAVDLWLDRKCGLLGGQ